MIVLIEKQTNLLSIVEIMNQLIRLILKIHGKTMNGSIYTISVDSNSCHQCTKLFVIVGMRIIAR